MPTEPYSKEFKEKVKNRLRDNHGYDFANWKDDELTRFDEIVEAAEKEIDIEINGK